MATSKTKKIAKKAKTTKNNDDDNKKSNLEKMAATTTSPTEAVDEEPARPTKPAKPTETPSSDATKIEIDALIATNERLKSELEMSKGLAMSYYAQSIEAETKLNDMKDKLVDLIANIHTVLDKTEVQIEDD